MTDKLDVTSFTSKDNKAAQVLVDLILQNNDESVFKAIVAHFTRFYLHLKELYDIGCYKVFYYKLVFDHHRQKIHNDKWINDRYKSFILNIMNARFAYYKSKVKEWNDAQIEYYDSESDNENNEIDEESAKS